MNDDNLRKIVDRLVEAEPGDFNWRVTLRDLDDDEKVFVAWELKRRMDRAGQELAEFERYVQHCRRRHLRVVKPGASAPDGIPEDDLADDL